MRLFVAVYPPPEALDDLGTAVDRLAIAHAAEQGINARLAARPLWHVTLAFLGDVPDTAGPDTAAAVDRAVAGTSQAPRLRIAGGGRFGRGRFTILWAGLTGEVDELRALSKNVRRELRKARLSYDEKPMRPHVTLARPGDRLPADAIAADLAALDGYEGPEWTVEAVRVVRSYPGPKPRYETLHTTVF